MSSEELKPCPFCGGKAERFTLQDEENFGGDVIVCTKCDACSRIVFGEKEGLNEAWNCRAQLAAIEAECERLRQFEVAYNDWQAKTDWVQESAKPHELGRHRADVLRARIEALAAQQGEGEKPATSRGQQR